MDSLPGGGAVTQCVVSRCNQGSGVCRSKRGLSRRVSLVSSHACTGGGSQYYLYVPDVSSDRCRFCWVKL